MKIASTSSNADPDKTKLALRVLQNYVSPFVLIAPDNIILGAHVKIAKELYFFSYIIWALYNVP